MKIRKTLKMNMGESIHLLMDFGLSLLQATIYLNLVKFDEADVNYLQKIPM
jgi:hypothetical protein